MEDETERFIQELEQAADNIADLPVQEVANLLMRAALRLRAEPTAFDVDRALHEMMEALDRAYDAQQRAK